METEVKISAKQVAKLVRKFHIIPGTLITIRDGSSIANAGFVESLSNGLRDCKVENVVIAIVKDHSDIRAISEVEMRRAGWVKLETLKRLVQKAQPNQPEHQEEKDDQSGPVG